MSEKTHDDAERHDESAPSESTVPRRSVRRRGRSVPRPHRLSVNFSDEEFASIVVAARAVEMTPASWIAEKAAAVARDEIRPAGLTERERLQQISDAQVAVSRIGNNLNQVARKVNMDEEAPELASVLRLVGHALQQLDDAAAAVIGGRRGR